MDRPTQRTEGGVAAAPEAAEVPGSAAEGAGALNPQDLIGMQTQAVKKRQTAPLKKSKGTPIRIPGVNPLMYLEAVDGVDHEDPEEGSGAAIFVEARMEPDIHQSTSAKKAVMNNRKGKSVPVTMKADEAEAAVEVSAGVTAVDSVGVTAVAAEAVEVSVADSAGVTAVAAEAVEVSAEVTAGVTEESPAGVTVVVAEVVEAADVAVVDRPMAKVAPKNKSKFQQQISNKERKESRSTLKNI